MSPCYHVLLCVATLLCRHVTTSQVIGLGEKKYGRKSLRSELMQQILGGVQTQMEKMHEEEILVKIGEKTREASHSQLIDKTKRDSNIDGWLQKRQSQSKLDLGAFSCISRSKSF